MFKARRYLKPRIDKAEEELIHTLDEATLLVEALVLQQSGSNSERFKTFDIKKVSIDRLNDVLFTLKNYIKGRLHFIDGLIDDIREDNLTRIKDNDDFTKVVIHSMKMNLISDNSNISLYLAPYIDSWDMLTAGVQVIILNHVINSINSEIQRATLAEKLSKTF
ncbi:MAG: hypothetical protein KGD59_12415 [Candidatus Heimdallarchaeota archaeon]|nr:hypothetical protein [Candidatus Heimdallarchaeota archaeon]MBY8995348.1 hypothetical protein [Candidatus Heimdallarchaeota archaeon]